VTPAMATIDWLLKTEPSGYSIDDWAAEPDQPPFCSGCVTSRPASRGLCVRRK